MSGRTWVVNGSLKIKAATWEMARMYARMRRLKIESICLYTSPSAAKRQQRQAIKAFDKLAV